MDNKKLGYFAIIGLVIGVILFVAVAIPVTAQVLSTVNSSGQINSTTDTVLDLLPLMLAVGALALIAFTAMGRGR